MRTGLDDWFPPGPAGINPWFRTLWLDEEVLFTFDRNSHYDGWVPDVDIVYARGWSPPFNTVVVVGSFQDEAGCPRGEMNDSGMLGDAVAGDGIWTLVCAVRTPGVYGYKMVTDGGSRYEYGGSGPQTDDAPRESLITTSPYEQVMFRLNTYTGRISPSGRTICDVTARFQVCIPVSIDQGDACVTGSPPELGRWQWGVPMTPCDSSEPSWRRYCVDVTFPPGSTRVVEYKFRKGGCSAWEDSIPNRTLVLDACAPAQTDAQVWNSLADSCLVWNSPVVPLTWGAFKGLYR